MYIKVHIFTDSKSDNLRKDAVDLYTAHVRAPAERGLANSSLLDLLKAEFPNSRIRIVSGHHHPHKIISID